MRFIKNQSGLTLIELLIALAISGMLLGAMVMAFNGQSTSYNNQQEVTTLQENMWAAMQLMSRDIRMAGYDPTGKAGAKIKTANATSFEATEDLNGDGTIGSEEDITYTLSGGTLKRNGQPVVVNNITNLGFEYETATSSGATSPWTWTWQSSVTGTTNLAKIRIVKICLQGRTNRKASTKDTTIYTPTDAPNTPNNAYYGLDTNTMYPQTTWTPSGADQYYRYRTMCTEVVPRNLLY